MSIDYNVYKGPATTAVFTRNLLDLVGDVEALFPDSPDVMTARRSVETVRKANPKLLVKAWHQHVTGPHGDHISRGDISFFVERDYSMDVSGIPQADQILAVIGALRDQIRLMDDTDKIRIMHQMQRLSAITRRILE